MLLSFVRFHRECVVKNYEQNQINKVNDRDNNEGKQLFRVEDLRFEIYRDHRHDDNGDYKQDTCR